MCWMGCYEYNMNLQYALGKGYLLADRIRRHELS